MSLNTHIKRTDLVFIYGKRNRGKTATATQIQSHLQFEPIDTIAWTHCLDDIEATTIYYLEVFERILFEIIDIQIRCMNNKNHPNGPLPKLLIFDDVFPRSFKTPAFRKLLAYHKILNLTIIFTFQETIDSDIIRRQINCPSITIELD